MKANSLILIYLSVIASVNAACIDVHATAGAGGVCFCNAGYYGTSTDSDPIGACQQCPNGTISALATTVGTPVTSCFCNDTNAYLNSGQFDCQKCNPNYYGTPNPIAGGPSGCSPCPAGTVSAAGSTSILSCNNCSDVNAFLNSQTPPVCQCKANFYGTPNSYGSKCIECPAGTVSVAGSTTANFYGTPTTSGGGCITCPTGTNSAAGSTTINSCTCTDTNASLNSAIPPVCQCNPNFYGIPTSSGASGCTICPLGQTAPAGSVTNICKSAIATSTLILPIASLLFCLLLLI
ncbi:immobilization antigen (macronuclear) [Tetrahymena thermophila SB210]|uniref:Immobilization antigen n=1 Tax=Tetrahymena thermophila (strain SB210) TaxID=312017 RepID=Q232E3_TETTS|nr:immobilization antigen [Tetrahymena thermophila SB210]EAR91469.2 immobilization antigen [Tetrahymena thermophila SB210]|eukprot:XP_001011714.2 immobilization antigen [Tetrahymena thermophila SB210]